MNRIKEFTQIVAQIHKDVNQKYDEYLPYEYHLRLALRFAEKFKYLLVNINEEYPISSEEENDRLTEAVLFSVLLHDVIEDARQSYNDVKKLANTYIHNNYVDVVAECVYAVTNEKGRNRKERANVKYYEGIRNTRYAVYVKLCDNMANTYHSVTFNSSQLDMHRKEHENFEAELRHKPNVDTGIDYQPMFEHLRWLKFDYKF